MFYAERFLVSTILATSFEPNVEALQNFGKLFEDSNPSEVAQVKLNCFIKTDSANKELFKDNSKPNKATLKTLLDRELAMLLADREVIFFIKHN